MHTVTEPGISPEYEVQFVQALYNISTRLRRGGSIFRVGFKWAEAGLFGMEGGCSRVASAFGEMWSMTVSQLFLQPFRNPPDDCFMALTQ